MDAQHSTEMYKHLEKQRELLMEAYRSFSHELHKLQVEEEMLMRKCYEVTSAEGLTGKAKVAKDDKTEKP
ncbi:hypothetical protein H6P81_020622 [Aristolochia fimbriata]|uniref:Uncharacterized protein n=1 Tax=Aristolochia fimbriata TaxID=158543 RepID=A0AAV7DZC4_ARIFI|nr:hypothetical protein H6P81_020622 [Aristolochia fimbriata]